MVGTARIVIGPNDGAADVDEVSQRSRSTGRIETRDRAVSGARETVIAVRVSILPDDRSRVVYRVAKRVAGVASQRIERHDPARRFAQERVSNAGTGVVIKSHDDAPVVHPVGKRLTERTVNIERRDVSFGCAHKAMRIVAAVEVDAG